MDLGFPQERLRRGFCSGETRVRPSDRIQRLTEDVPDLAQAGQWIPGPGPCCGLGTGERARARGEAGRWAVLSRVGPQVRTRWRDGPRAEFSWLGQNEQSK